MGHEVLVGQWTQTLTFYLGFQRRNETIDLDIDDTRNEMIDLYIDDTSLVFREGIRREI